ncbi:M23 family metallopeptidase [Ornithinimicrobium cavernae]|uniref:M23 family metallopeptidase n=1 Tax=Ornithinimicrobium cavernae TaxID=2666047 RepID=UPI0012B17FF5|nr:M23 family metallopeptidase [Ornithinimicrobium cavernae]
MPQSRREARALATHTPTTRREARALATHTPTTRREARALATQTTRREARALATHTPSTRREARALATRNSGLSALPPRLLASAVAAAFVTATSVATVVGLPTSVTAGTTTHLSTAEVLFSSSDAMVSTPAMIRGRGASVASRGSTPRLSLAWGVAAAAEGRRTMSVQMEAIRSSVTVGVDATEGARSHAREIAADRSFHEPILSGHQTSGFGWRWGRMHNGIDYGADTGTPLYAVGHGTVTSAGWSSGLGYHVRLTLESGEVIVYGHLSRISVMSGERVSPGTQVGEVGSTGRSTGAHLHFEVRTEQGPVDPVPWLEAQRG